MHACKKISLRSSLDCSEVVRWRLCSWKDYKKVKIVFNPNPQERDEKIVKNAYMHFHDRKGEHLFTHAIQVHAFYIT